jgi:hypothetical protein
VVEPMQRIVPPESAGFSRFEASIAPPDGCARADHGVDFVDEQDRVRQLFQLVDDRLQAFLEVAAIARAREQRAHVERVDDRRQQHLGHLPSMILRARPSAMAVLPTPGSPT